MREGSGDVAFYIIDAAFSDLRDLLRFHYRRDVGVPLDPLAYGYASLVNYLRDGYFFGAASPRRSIASVRTPVLFIHGRADPVIPYRMTEELYRAKPGVKLLLIHDGGHGLVQSKGGGAIAENRAAFERKVDKLLAPRSEGRCGTKACTVRLFAPNAPYRPLLQHVMKLEQLAQPLDMTVISRRSSARQQSSHLDSQEQWS
jgi:fermentation-respiration switch protein FrsA (DUF1100 family)